MRSCQFNSMDYCILWHTRFLLLFVFMSLFTVSKAYIGGHAFSPDSYFDMRAKLVKDDALHRTGQDIHLSRKELTANDILMKAKRKELKREIENDYSLPSKMFTTVIPEIENTEIFKIIRKMPKGALLHSHDLSLASYDWLVKNVTYRDTCYMCYNITSKITMFTLALRVPVSKSDCAWTSCLMRREMSGDVTKFDAELYKNWTFVDQDIKVLYPTQEKLWEKFLGIFSSVGGLISNVDVYKEYYIRALDELLDDNVQYVEIRALLVPLYDLDGTQYTSQEAALKIYEAATNHFVANHIMEFHGARIIYICVRTLDTTAIRECIKTAMKLQQDYGSMFAGFDLVGHEDAGHPLLYFLEELLMPSKLKRDMKFFFHAGETDWEGQHVDNNLIDAYLLNSSRVGHGFALPKHPELMQLYRQKNISAEVCPISNQVLGLISDLRQHPAVTFLSKGFPMTVNNDDPAIWGSKGVSHDWFEVFMGMTRAEDGLEVLKQLAMDSIRFTSLDPDRRKDLMNLFQRKWDQFISDIIANNF